MTDKKEKKSEQDELKVKNPVPMIRDLDPEKKTTVKINLPALLIVLAIVISGSVTGFVLANIRVTGINNVIESETTKSGLKKIVGAQDEKTFKDSTEGLLQEGGIDGEGSHHLERPGGPSQTVYLTSSTIALSDYVGKKVKIWGETFAAQKAGWFMDVGRLELLE